MGLSKATDGLSGKGPMYLMSKDKIVAAYNLDKNIVKIINFNLLPFGLRHSNLSTNNIEEWLGYRVLSLSRSNADKIAKAVHLSKNQKLDLCYYCRALSLIDCYWIKEVSSTIKWGDINLYNNKLNKVLTSVALYGIDASIQGRACTPEITGKGGYTKCFRRDNDKIYMIKLGTKATIRNNEADIEILVSDLLDQLDVRHVKYKAYTTKINARASKCELITSENISICSGNEFTTYCNNKGMPVELVMLKMQDFLKMLIVDYLIWNTDRHGENWGLEFNPDTGKVIGLHPLLDHNNCLVWNDSVKERSMTLPERTIIDAARMAKGRVKLSTDRLLTWAYTKQIKKRFHSIFGNDEVYKQFIQRIITYRAW